MTEARRKAYAFLMLPFHEQVGRAREAGVYDEADQRECAKVPQEGAKQQLLWVQRAKEKGTLAVLMKEL